jgi:phage-related protein
VVQWQVEFYQLSDGSSPVLAWFREQEAKVQAKFARIFDLLTEHGIAVGMPFVRSIPDSKLFEIRVEENTNTYRIFYLAYTGQRFILLHGFQKKTQKTPKQELEIAKVRLKAFLAEEKQPTPKAKNAKSQERRKKK